MQILSLVWGILAVLGLGIAFVPCLGSLNWINIPFAVVGLIISTVARSQPGNRGAANIGVILNAIAIAFGVVRLFLGGGVV
jgi:hypothetical protein